MRKTRDSGYDDVVARHSFIEKLRTTIISRLGNSI